MPPKLQLLAVVAFAVAMLFLENQIQKLEESRAKLGEAAERCAGVGLAGGHRRAQRVGVGGAVRGLARRVPRAGTQARRAPATGEGSCARGLRPEGCPVGPPRREGTEVCVELELLEDANAHPLVSPESFWKAPVMCGEGDWNLN